MKLGEVSNECVEAEKPERCADLYPDRAGQTSALLRPPENRKRRFHHAGHVAAPRLIAQEESGRDFSHEIHRILVHLVDGELFGCKIRGTVPFGDIGHYLIGFWPTEPGAISRRNEVTVGRR